jgi:hypothetical protein
MCVCVCACARACVMKSKDPKIDPGELHVLLFPILRNISQMILFQFFLFSILSDNI